MSRIFKIFKLVLRRVFTVISRIVVRPKFLVLSFFGKVAKLMMILFLRFQ
jgi:hypothetical protein